MKTVNLLDFLNNTRVIKTLSFARCDNDLVNFLDLMTEDEQFTRTIDLGLIFVHQTDTDQYILVDGLSRILSLSLLLHAICECYKKTSSQNEKAIKTIRTKYLTKGNGLKLHLNPYDMDLYSKIVNGERLSGHEKATPMFRLLHNFWTQIKEEKLQAAKIFIMLQKVKVTLAETGEMSRRDLYYKINKKNREINQIDLIEDYLAENKLSTRWNEIKNSCFARPEDIPLFFRDFFITKFNYKNFSMNRLYESFVNFYETMTQYLPKETLMSRLKRSALLYYNIININFNNESIKNALIQINKHNGEDTYAYILSIYEDYFSGNISESIFIEILQTIDEYLQKRESSGKNIDFNELIQYLNAFIACK